MKRMILFRFYKKLEICKNRINLLRRFNPNIEIYGLSGGDIDLLPNVYKIKSPDLFMCDYNTWAWKHNDLAIRDWFRDVGHKLDFDILQVVEWDLLLLDSIENIFGKVPANKVGLTGLKPIYEVPNNWPWLSKEPALSEWRGQISFVNSHYNYEFDYYACQGPGFVFPRKFLELYSDADVLCLCHEELRLPLYAKALGFELCDNGITDNWITPYFNCRETEISKELVEKEWDDPNGKRVFHPYYDKF